MSPCPTQDRLEEFVRGGAAEQDIFEHVENCESCGQIIERLCETLGDEISRPTQSGKTAAARPEDREFLLQLAKRSPSAMAETIVFPQSTSADYLGAIDGYQVIRQIDSGGFGQVFEALETQLNRRVALKLLAVSDYDSTALSRFQREAKAAGSIQHENVVVLHRVLEPTEAFPYACLVMEYVRGGSLKQRIDADQPPEIKQSVQWMIQATRGLAAVHRSGMLHRDLKPANMLLDEAGKLKLGDFGLARPLVAEAQMSMLMAGTPPYMSPEQLLKPDQLTVQSDIYGLGVVFYQLLTGVRPFQGRGEGLRKQIIENAPPSIRALNPRVPHDLETICLRCLHKDPTRRFESAQALEADLQNWLDGKPITSRPIGRLEKAGWWIRQNPTLTAVLAASLIIAVITSVAAYGFKVMAEKEAEARRIADENADIATRSQVDSLKTFIITLSTFQELTIDRQRLVPMYEHIIDRLDSLKLPTALQPYQTKAIAEAHVLLGETYDLMVSSAVRQDVSAKSRDEFYRAIEMLEPLGDTEAQILVSAYIGLANNATRRRDWKEIEQSANKAQQVCLRAKPGNNDDELLRLHSITFEKLATVERERGNEAAELEQLSKCVEIRRQLAQRPKPNANAEFELCNALMLLTDLTRRQDILAAIELCRETMAISEKALAINPDNVPFQRTLANCFDRMHLFVPKDEKLAWAEKAEALREKIHRIYPADRTSINDLVVSYLGIMNLKSDPTEKKKYMDLASELVDPWLKSDSTDAGAKSHKVRLQLAYSQWYLSQNEYEQALPYAQEVVKQRRELLERNQTAGARRLVIVGLNTLADIQTSLNRVSESIAIRKEQLELLKQMAAANELAADMQTWQAEIEEKIAALEKS